MERGAPHGDLAGSSTLRHTVIDLFAGAGGFSVGFQAAGFKILAAIENVPVFAKTHKHNFPDCDTVVRDIGSLPPAEFSRVTAVMPGTVDVVIGSPPCQTFSTIGVPKINSLAAKDVKADPRNYLFKDFLAYVEYFRPAAFVMENVPGMQTRFGGLLFQRLLMAIDSAGYQSHVRVLNSVHYGAPQTRKRLFVVGTAKGIRFAFPEMSHSTEFDLDSEMLPIARGRLDAPTTVYDAIGDLPIILDGCRDDLLPYGKNADLTAFQVRMRNPSGYVRNNICRVSNDRAKAVFEHMRPGTKYMDLPEQVRKILPFREDIFRDRLKRLDLSKPSWTVLAHIGMDGYMYIHPSQNRTLSVREAARLQSFPDSFVFLGNMREQYVQVGNAVPPLLAERIAQSLLSIAGEGK